MTKSTKNLKANVEAALTHPAPSHAKAKGLTPKGLKAVTSGQTKKQTTEARQARARREAEAKASAGAEQCRKANKPKVISTLESPEEIQCALRGAMLLQRVVDVTSDEVHINVNWKTGRVWLRDEAMYAEMHTALEESGLHLRGEQGNVEVSDKPFPPSKKEQAAKIEKLLSADPALLDKLLEAMAKLA